MFCRAVSLSLIMLMIVSRWKCVDEMRRERERNISVFVFCFPVPVIEELDFQNISSD